MEKYAELFIGKMPKEKLWFNGCERVYNIEILNPFDSELPLISTKPVIENQLKGFLDELKKLNFRQFQS